MGNPWMKLRSLLLAGAASVAALSVQAKEITIGVSAEPTAVDPHFHSAVTNNWMSRHAFDALVIPDPNLQLLPGLALSWKPLDELTWEFKLRRGVKFHDGTEFTADDAIFSIRRSGNVPNSPGTFAHTTAQIAKMEAPEPHTLRITTTGPHPLLPRGLGQIGIISKRAAEGKTTAEINAGSGAVGTGPYRFVEWVRGSRIVFERNDVYWGDKSQWRKVTFRPLTNNAARVSALLAGDVQVINAVPPADLPRLRQHADIDLFRSGGATLVFLHMDSNREISPFALGPDGKNPLRDARVRKALSLAINRQAIVDRLMNGAAIAAGQLVAKGVFGHAPDLKPDAYDPEGAKKLLAEAGLGNGFKVTLHGPNDRYVNDHQIVQAIAQMLSRVGVTTTVETMPANVYFPRGSKLEFSLMLLGWGSTVGVGSDPMRALLATHDRGKGMGTFNRGRYSNRQMDELLMRAITTFDDTRRESLEHDATRVVIGDYGLIPLHWQTNVWAVRKGIAYPARLDEGTLAHHFTATGQ